MAEMAKRRGEKKRFDFNLLPLLLSGDTVLDSPLSIEVLRYDGADWVDVTDEFAPEQISVSVEEVLTFWLVEAATSPEGQQAVTPQEYDPPVLGETRVKVTFATQEGEVQIFEVVDLITGRPRLPILAIRGDGEE